ncbi:CPBP family intramembrane glutamic endopeptidase [Runella slithyformis]|uniref:Abortive infection protein n=1 Tax=Runella slithyformis (strain ATCC 29530 / DSM 19594 / LMG 11500 / NCIMB 11436 / LSU 4) TaxID=761193 RepID=A0A7U3ZLH5_RUNSL|nr:CPBP family intramembrane glutamic endopeptidase [Runella slithyformis]AEI49395.1 Abortive infection protein [Runella slithyformis DSM 19594]
MEEIQPDIIHSIPQRPPWRNGMLLLGLIMLGMSVGNIVAMLIIISVGAFIEGPNFEDISRMVQEPGRFPYAWWYLMILHSVSHLFTFLIPGVVYWRWSEKHRVEEFVRRPLPSFVVLILVLLTVVTFLPLNSWIIEWNSHLHLPEGLHRMEDWMRRKEDELLKMTLFLTDFNSWPKFGVALLVIAILPAIGEEVLFRGIIQRKIFHKTRDVHSSVWLTAMLFSAIHLQFYGFVPRMLLGAMFGYMYFWARNLWAPIFAHFINNGLTVLAIFLSHRKVLNFEVGTSESSVSWIGAFLSLALTAVLLLNLKRISQRSQNVTNDTKPLGKSF